jgi:hypothetical protein
MRRNRKIQNQLKGLLLRFQPRPLMRRPQNTSHIFHSLIQKMTNLNLPQCKEISLSRLTAEHSLKCDKLMKGTKVT